MERPLKPNVPLCFLTRVRNWAAHPERVDRRKNVSKLEVPKSAAIPQNRAFVTLILLTNCVEYGSFRREFLSAVTLNFRASSTDALSTDASACQLLEVTIISTASHMQVPNHGSRNKCFGSTRSTLSINPDISTALSSAIFAHCCLKFSPGLLLICGDWPL